MPSKHSSTSTVYSLNTPYLNRRYTHVLLFPHSDLPKYSHIQKPLGGNSSHEPLTAKVPQTTLLTPKSRF